MIENLKSKIIKRKTDTFLKMILPTGLTGADNLSKTKMQLRVMNLRSTMLTGR